MGAAVSAISTLVNPVKVLEKVTQGLGSAVDCFKKLASGDVKGAFGSALGTVFGQAPAGTTPEADQSFTRATSGLAGNPFDPKNGIFGNPEDDQAYE